MSETFERPYIEFETVRRIVKHHLDVEVTPESTKEVLTGLFNTSFFLTAGSRELVLRIAPLGDEGLLFYEKGMMVTEPMVHRLIREKTDLPVPEIIAYDDSGGIIPNRYLIMQKLPGRPLSDVSLSAEMLEEIQEELGGMVRKLHDIGGDSFGYNGRDKVMTPRDNWPDAMLEMISLILGDCCAVGIYNDQEAEEARKLFEKQRSLLDHEVTSTLLHMDLWQENILIGDDNRISGIVDIDRSIWGDVELEFAILDICGLSTEAFFAGYGAPRDTSKEAEIRRKIYTLYEFFKYLYIYTVRRPNPTVFSWYLTHTQRLLREIYLSEVN
ncbi:phosphotransferase family protein [candidate division KSB1 bacterium]